MRIVVTEKQLGMLASYQSDLGEQDSGTETGTGDGTQVVKVPLQGLNSGKVVLQEVLIIKLGLLNGLKLLDQKAVEVKLIHFINYGSTKKRSYVGETQ